jgi:hypothetical protein
MRGWTRLFLAAVAPLAVFGALHALLVHPQRAASGTAREQLAAAAANDARRQAGARPGAADAHHEGGVFDPARAIANSAEAGGALNLSIDSATGTVSFDASEAQVEGFFRDLLFLPGPFRLRQVDLAPASDTRLMHVTLGLGAGKR